MFTEKNVEALFKEPWWDLVKNEVLRTIVCRINAARNGTPRIGGSLLGQAFVDLMNREPEYRRYVHYLSTRAWAELVDAAAPNLSENSLGVLKDSEAFSWFAEFKKFLIDSWKASTSDQIGLEIMDRPMLEVLLQELDRHINAGKPEFMVNTIMEAMKDPVDHRLRKSASTAVTFMMVRSWTEVLSAIEKKYGMDVSGLETRAAAAFFDRMKFMIGAVMGEYWEAQEEAGRVE